jgi:hypothetical protein
MNEEKLMNISPNGRMKAVAAITAPDVEAEDATWFAQHPGRTYRARHALPDEGETAAFAHGDFYEEGARCVVIVRQIEPGKRIRWCVYIPASETGRAIVLPPDNDRTISRLFGNWNAAERLLAPALRPLLVSEDAPAGFSPAQVDRDAHDIAGLREQFGVFFDDISNAVHFRLEIDLGAEAGQRYFDYAKVLEEAGLLALPAPCCVFTGIKAAGGPNVLVAREGEKTRFAKFRGNGWYIST